MGWVGKSNVRRKKEALLHYSSDEFIIKLCACRFHEDSLPQKENSPTHPFPYILQELEVRGYLWTH